MKSKGSRRRQRRLDQLSRWLEEFWSCGCEYHNVASFRCFGCGARPPRSVCARVASKPTVDVEDPATTPVG